jgi:predicted RNA-binding protein YlxR (DUF448 family)
MKMKSTSPNPTHTRHVPQRTCLGCRQVRAKRELIRIVRTPDGNIEIDTTGRKTGRGTYLCPNLACWEAGLNGNRLDHALHASLSKDSRQQLMKHAEEHLKGVASGPGEKTG